MRRLIRQSIARCSAAPWQRHDLITPLDGATAFSNSGKPSTKHLKLFHCDLGGWTRLITATGFGAS